MDARWPYVPRSVELWRVKHEPEPGAGAWGGAGAGVSEAAAPARPDLYAGHEDDEHMLEQTPPNNSLAAPPLIQDLEPKSSCEVSIEHELLECRVLLERIPIPELITSDARGAEERDGRAAPGGAGVERGLRDTAIGNIGGDDGDADSDYSEGSEGGRSTRTPAMAPTLSGENTDSGGCSPATAPSTLSVENTGSSVVIAAVPTVPGVFCAISPESKNKEYFPTRRDILDAEVVVTDDADSLHSCQNGCKSGDVLRELKEIKSFVTFIMQKVEGIETSLSKMNGAEPKPTLLPKLPLTQIKELESFEALLVDDNIRTQLFDMLRHSGGSKERDCVNRCLEKIFSNYLGQYCSWTGKKNNYKLASLTLMDVIKCAVRQTYPHMTDESFERHVMNWFQHAGTRLKRHELL